MRPLSLCSVLLLIALYLPNVYSQPNVNEQCVKFVNLTTATLVGEDGVIMKTTDNGWNWVEQTSGVTNVLNGNHFVDVNTAFAVGENGIVLKTINGGDNWDIMASGVTDNLLDVEVVNANTVVACGENGTIILSTDAGETWTTVERLTTFDLTDICFFGGITGYVIGNSGAFLKSTDAGLTWLFMSAPSLGGDLKAISAKSANDLTAVGDPGIVLNSTDGGLIWTPVEQQMPNVSFNDVYFMSATDGIIIGNDANVFKTTDGGLTWEAEIARTVAASPDFMSVSFSNATNGIIVGENGLELYSTDGGATWEQNAPAITANANLRAPKNEISQVRNYPNPFNPSTIISFVMPKAGMLKIAVYDMTGKEVTRLFDGYSNSGTQEFVFNAANLSSGIYFYSISAEGLKTVTNKMILVK